MILFNGGFVNNSYDLNRSSLILVRQNINNNQIGGLKKLTQEQRRILRLAVLVINADSPGLTISKETRQKIITPTAYEKKITDTIRKSVSKIFNDKYIDFNELSELVGTMELGDDQNEERDANII